MPRTRAPRAATRRRSASSKPSDQRANERQRDALDTLRTTNDPAEREQARFAAARSDAERDDARRIRREASPTRPTTSGDMTGIVLPEEQVHRSGKTYRVLHGALGRHPYGTVVYASELVDAANVKRLVEKGAIEEVSKADIDQEDFDVPRTAAEEEEEDDDERTITEKRQAVGDVAADSKEAKQDEREQERAEKKAEKTGEPAETIAEREGVAPDDPALAIGQPVGPAPEPDRTGAPTPEPEEK